MRNKSLDALFPSVRQGILAATLLRPQKSWYLSELAQHLGTRPSSLQRELASLVLSGILEQRRDGRRTYFRAETRSPLFSNMRRLFEMTVGVVPGLRQALLPFGERIAYAFVYGSVARGAEHAVSDIDLMVVGSAGLADLSSVLRRAERRFGREINVTHYSIAEFQKKLAAGDHFLQTVLRSPKQFVKGSARELDRVTGKKRDSKAPHITK